jgi:CRISPR system Cascade subunit CasE
VFVSKLVLNPRNRQARCDLTQPYEMHRTLMNSYPHARVESRCDLLFRVEPSKSGPPIVLVQTRDASDWSRLSPGYLLEAAETKPLTLGVAPGHRLRFRLRANPTKKIGTASKVERLAGKKDNGQRKALFREVDQVAWLLNKAEHDGFRIPGKWLQNEEGVQVPSFRVDVIPEGWVRCSKNGHTDGRFFAVRFDGLLEVTDPGAFLETVRAGIGSAKGLGFGLLSLARVGG